MKAAVYRRYGPPEQVRVVQTPRPGCDDNELLVKVSYSTVNRTDCGMLRAQPFFVRLFWGLTGPKERKQILGIDFAGRVESAGKQVTRFSKGDLVFGMAPLHFGAHAEYMVVAANSPNNRWPEGFSPACRA